MNPEALLRKFLNSPAALPAEGDLLDPTCDRDCIRDAVLARWDQSSVAFCHGFSDWLDEQNVPNVMMEVYPRRDTELNYRPDTRYASTTRGVHLMIAFGGAVLDPWSGLGPLPFEDYVKQTYDPAQDLCFAALDPAQDLWTPVPGLPGNHHYELTTTPGFFLRVWRCAGVHTDLVLSIDRASKDEISKELLLKHGAAQGLDEDIMTLVSDLHLVQDKLPPSLIARHLGL